MGVEWNLLLFGLIAGIGAALFGIACIANLRGKAQELHFALAITALVALLVGGVISFFHLNIPSHVFYVMANPLSGISLELIFIALTIIVLIVWLILEKKNASPTAQKVFSILGLILGIIFPYLTGHVYFIMYARPAWHHVFLPIMYFVAAWFGALLVATLIALIKKADGNATKALSRFSLIACIVFAVAVGLFLVGVGTAPMQDPSRSVAIITTGEYAALFWTCVVLLGFVVPLVSLFLLEKQIDKALKNHVQPAGLAYAVVALGCFLAGSVVLRMIVYMIGTSIHSYIY